MAANKWERGGMASGPAPLVPPCLWPRVTRDAGGTSLIATHDRRFAETPSSTPTTVPASSLLVYYASKERKSWHNRKTDRQKVLALLYHRRRLNDSTTPSHYDGVAMLLAHIRSTNIDSTNANALQFFIVPDS